MPDNATLTVSRQIAATPEAIWKVWMAPENFEKWWCPRPWKGVSKKFDPRPGGAFDFTFFGPDGEEFILKGSFLELDQYRRIVFTSLMEEDYQPVTAELLFTAIITLEAANGGTMYTATARHRSREEAEKHAEMGFEEGWGRAIAQLAELVE